MHNLNRLPVPKRAFTLIELLVVASIISMLAGLVLPALSRAREQGRRATCLSNLHQLHLATTFYATDHDGSFPAREEGRRWPSQMGNYSGQPKVLLCPNDRQARPTTDLTLTHPLDLAPRSYVLNGFQNPNVTTLSNEDWPAYLTGPMSGTIHDNAIQHPSDTILLGEKLSSSAAFYADLHRRAGSFVEVIDSAPHRGTVGSAAPAAAKGGGANHAFADGSVRYLSNGKSTCPLNLWGVTDYYRTNYSLCFF